MAVSDDLEGRLDSLRRQVVRHIDAFDKDDTAAQFMREDGEGGFPGAVYRMARYIDQLECAARALLDYHRHSLNAGPALDCGKPADEALLWHALNAAVEASKTDMDADQTTQ